MKPALARVAPAPSAFAVLLGIATALLPGHPSADVPAAPSTPAEPAGDALGPKVLHSPILERRAEQGILRPVPIEIELPREVALRARRVLVHYRTWGSPDWLALEMRRDGTRYRGAIPCLEISTISGLLRYYIRVHDIDGRVIATGASRAAPYVVTIKHDTMLTAAQKRTAKCPDPADCPAGLLGCPSAPVKHIQCDSDADCEGGETCSWRGFCERTERRTAWPMVGLQQDFGFVRTSGACSVPSQENDGYGCYRADGTQYIGHPVLTNEPVGAGIGPTRILIGYDHLVSYDLTLGVRVGWALRGAGPTSPGAVGFIPVSAALRVAHWFGDDPFGRAGFRPFLFVTAGYAMFDIATTTRVREDPTKTPYQGDNDLEQELDVYKRAGDGFVGAGAGFAVLATPYLAAMLEIGALGAFPVSAFLLAPSTGVTIGF